MDGGDDALPALLGGLGDVRHEGRTARGDGPPADARPDAQSGLVLEGLGHGHGKAEAPGVLDDRLAQWMLRIALCGGEHGQQILR